MEDNEPLKVNGHGYRMGLSVVLDADTEDYSVTNGNFDGFKVRIYLQFQTQIIDLDFL